MRFKDIEGLVPQVAIISRRGQVQMCILGRWGAFHSMAKFQTQISPVPTLMTVSKWAQWELGNLRTHTFPLSPLSCCHLGKKIQSCWIFQYFKGTQKSDYLSKMPWSLNFSHCFVNLNKTPGETSVAPVQAEYYLALQTLWLPLVCSFSSWISWLVFWPSS